MRLKTCATCPHWGDPEEEKDINGKSQRPCHGALPEISPDPRGLGRFPFMPRDGWCAHHGLKDSTATHTTADDLEFGPPEAQPT